MKVASALSLLVLKALARREFLASTPAVHYGIGGRLAHRQDNQAQRRKWARRVESNR